jgi:hypothetical protein
MAIEGLPRCFGSCQWGGGTLKLNSSVGVHGWDDPSSLLPGQTFGAPNNEQKSQRTTSSANCDGNRKSLPMNPFLRKGYAPPRFTVVLPPVLKIAKF